MKVFSYYLGFTFFLFLCSCSVFERKPDLSKLADFSGIHEVRQTGFSSNNQPQSGTNWDTTYTEDIQFSYVDSLVTLTSESGNFDSSIPFRFLNEDYAHFFKNSSTKFILTYFYKEDSISIWIRNPGLGVCDCYYVDTKL